MKVCEKNEQYFNKDQLDKAGLKDTDNVEIPFASPDSSVLCKIKVNEVDATIESQNKELITTSQILFYKVLLML